MKNLRKILILLSSSLLVLSMAACAKKNNVDENVATPSQASELEKPKSYGEVKLGKFKGIDLLIDKIEIKDEDVDAQINSLVKSSTKTNEIKDRAVISGDIANIDYEGKKDGVAFDGGSAKAYDLKIGSNSFIPGFEEAVIGMNIGETKDIPLKFPEEYNNKDLAGKDVVFTVKLNKIKEEIPAKLDDSWVKEFSKGKQKTVAEFKKAVRKQMEDTSKAQMDYKQQADAMKIVMDSSTIEPSEEAIEYEKNFQYEQLNKSIQENNMTMDDMLSMYNITKEQLDSQIEQYAKDSVSRKLLVDEIAKKAKIKVKDKHRQFLAKQEGISLKELNQRYGKELVEEAAKRYAVAKYVVDNANKKEKDYNKLDIQNQGEAQNQGESQNPEESSKQDK